MEVTLSNTVQLVLFVVYLFLFALVRIPCPLCMTGRVRTSFVTVTAHMKVEVRIDKLPFGVHLLCIACALVLNMSPHKPEYEDTYTVT